MLLNLWTDTEDPFAPLGLSDRIADARRAALNDDADAARSYLEALARTLRDLGTAAHDAQAAVELELARLRAPRAGYLKVVSQLQLFLEQLDKAPVAPRLKAALRAVAHSEQELVQVLLMISTDAFKQFGDIPRQMALNRVQAVSELGLRHPAVGLLNYHLAVASLRLRDYATALEFLGEANACFQRLPTRFALERSDVLLAWAEAAVELGNLDQAETLLRLVLRLKDAGHREKPAGIPLGPKGPYVSDRSGLAKCHGILGKLQHCQGRYDQALASFEADARLSNRAREQGFVANRRAQIYLEMNAHDVAEQLFRRNAECKDSSPLNRAHAFLGLTRTIMAKTMPAASADVALGPRLVQQRRQTRETATQSLREVLVIAETLKGPNRLHLLDLHQSHEQVVRAISRLDAADLVEYEQVRQELVAKAQDLRRRHEPLRAAELLEVLLRMEWWAWHTHGHVSSKGQAETFPLLLDLWEQLGAMERLDRLEQWAEVSGYDTIHRVLLERYVHPVVRGQEVRLYKPMTILFTDIRDYSGHCQVLEKAERIAELEADLFRVINPNITAHQGAILRYQGDSILVVFNLDGNDADHAEHAVNCAVRIQQDLRHWNRLRRSSDAKAVPVELPTGIHTGNVAVAHFRIPGRREMTVVGNAVNLAKRVQEKAREFPEESVLVSGKTLHGVHRGVFRAVLLEKDCAFKGYMNAPTRLDVYSVRPAVSHRTSFIGVGSVLNPQPGVVALDVGNRAESGILDHHQPEVPGCATSLVHEHPDWVRPGAGNHSSGRIEAELELVVHAEPDFDCCAATLLTLEILEGRFPRSESPDDERRAAALQALAEYATAVDRGMVEIDPHDPASSPYALLAVSDLIIREELPKIAPSQFQRDRRRLEWGVHILHLAVQRFMDTRGDPAPPAFAHIFRGAIPPQLQDLADLARQDHATYLNEDLKGLQRLDDLTVPERKPPHARRPQKACYLTEPKSRLFKVWMRQEGCELLLVQTARDPLRQAHGDPIPLWRYVISVLPDSGLTLAALGSELERRETERRDVLLEKTGDRRLARDGPPRPGGFPNSDPWYDGRSAVLANTIVDTPRLGSVLELDKVLEAVRKLYGDGVGGRTH